MKTSKKNAVTVLLASLLMVFVMFGCQASEDEEDADPCVAGSVCESINGTWSYTGYATVNSGACGSGWDDPTTFYVSQAGGECTFTLNVPSIGRSGTGTVDESSVCLNSTAYPDSSGTTSLAKTTLTYNGSNEITGTSSWTWKDGSSNCEGTTAVTLSAP